MKVFTLPKLIFKTDITLNRTLLPKLGQHPGIMVSSLTGNNSTLLRPQLLNI